MSALYRNLNMHSAVLKRPCGNSKYTYEFLLCSSQFCKIQSSTTRYSLYSIEVYLVFVFFLFSWILQGAASDASIITTKIKSQLIQVIKLAGGASKARAMSGVTPSSLERISIPAPFLPFTNLSRHKQMCNVLWICFRIYICI